MVFAIEKKELIKLSRDNNYSVNNIEKVLRLCDLLNTINSDTHINGKLVLKGGTAINLVVFEHIPRLSVDLDFDYAYNIEKNDMIKERANINILLKQKLEEKGYLLSYRNTFTLDSIHLKYKTLSGSWDKIKLDINYQNRCHIFKPISKIIAMPFLNDGTKVYVNSLQDIELFAGKIKAFYERCKPRDLFDIYTIAKSGRINDNETKKILRKCIYFYGSIGNIKSKPIFDSDVKRILNIPFQDIKTQLLPMLHINNGKYPKDEINKTIIDFLSDIMNPDSNNIEFWNKFKDGKYEPEIIFDNCIAKELKNHPVALYSLQIIKENANSIKIDRISIYSDFQNINHFVRCYINGERQLSVKIADEDYRLYRNGMVDKESLAQKYFKNEIDCATSRRENQGLKR